VRTVDRVAIRAPLARVFEAAAQVERWPAILPHYRWVRLVERSAPDESVVEMAAARPFGPLRYPAWWVSLMTVDRPRSEIRYRHIRGITRGMDVVWHFAPRREGGEDVVDVTIVHRWSGPAWPVVGGWAARCVIGPVFVRGIASRTLAGMKRHLEGQ
jgi:coenzyme Q-binding protein COQ10